MNTMILVNRSVRDKRNFYVGAQLTSKQGDFPFITVTLVTEHGVGYKNRDGMQGFDYNTQIERGSWDGCSFIANFSTYYDEI